MGLLWLIFMVFFLLNCVHATTVTSAMASSYSGLVNHSRALSAEDDEKENQVQALDELTAIASEERTINLKALVDLAKRSNLPPEYLNGMDVPVHFMELSHNGIKLMPLWERLQQYPQTLSNEAVKNILIQEIKRGAQFSEHGSIRKANGHSLLLSDPARSSHTVSEARTGREKQLYDEHGNKMMVAGVVLNKQRQVLLISSSNLEKIEWILPKGGWEVNENYLKALSRELYEEAGVTGHVMQGLDLVQITGKRKKDGANDPDSLWIPSIVFLEKEEPIWPENARGRLWVYPNDAIKLLEHMKRTEMAKVVKNAMDKYA